MIHRSGEEGVRSLARRSPRHQPSRSSGVFRTHCEYNVECAAQTPV